MWKSVKNREELARHLEVHHRRIVTAKSCVDCSVPNSLVKHIKRRALACIRKTESDRKTCEWGTHPSVQVVHCDGRMQATRPVKHGTTGNASGSGATEVDLAASAHNPYCDYLDLDSSCLRSDLYHTRTGKMAAHVQRLQRKEVSSTPPWKPGGVSSPKCPHLDMSSPSPRARNSTKRVTGTCNKLCGQTTPPCASSYSCETVPLHDISYPSQRAHSEKRVSFRESLSPITSEDPSPEATPSCVGSPSPEATPSCVGSPPETTPSCFGSPPEATPSFVGSPSPEATPSCVGSPSPEATPSCVGSPSPEATPSCVGSPPLDGMPSHTTPPAESNPFMDESIASYVEIPVLSTPFKSTSPKSMRDHIKSPSPGCTPSRVESPPPPEGSNKCVVTAKDTRGVQMLSEMAELSRCTDGLLKQLEEAKRRVTSRRKEAQYLHFLSEVTRDILSRGVLSKAALEILFRSHVESKCHELDKEVLLQKIGELKLQLGIAD
eukprot:Em0019g809a